MIKILENASGSSGLNRVDRFSDCGRGLLAGSTRPSLPNVLMVTPVRALISCRLSSTAKISLRSVRSLLSQ